MSNEKEMNLSDLAKFASANHGEVIPSDTVETVDEANLPNNPEVITTDNDEPTIVFGTTRKEEEAKIEMARQVEETTHSRPKVSPIKFEDEDALATPNMPEKIEIAPSVDPSEVKTYVKSLIMSGFSPEEANTAAKAHFDKKSVEDAAKTTASEDAVVGVIEINKKDASSEVLGLTEDEHKKLQKVQSIRLVVVEDADLKTIKVDPIKSEHKANYIRSIDGSLSKYGVPLPILGDFVSFRGAQIIQLANAISYEDDKIEEVINKKASLIYDKLIDGGFLKKFGENGKVIMSYSDFANIYPYADIDMGLFGILCASSMEENSSSMKCPNCDTTWDEKYNVKTLLQMDGLSDQYKQRYEDILTSRGNAEAIKDLYDQMHKARRYKSPFTQNIYDVSYPTVARASQIMKRIDQNDQVAVYDSALAIYMNQILVYNPSSDSYVSVPESEPDVMMQTIMTICDEDIQLLLDQIAKELVYSPKFAIHATCPNCKKEHVVDVGIEQLVFLKAQDSSKEIH